MISPEELPSRRFEPVRYGVGAWTEHIFFAYDLVAQLRPTMLVELGTDRGESYFAFCQSALENATGTRCFAIDHWQGDSHAGSYDETTFRDVASANRKYFAAFSTLLRSSFDDALDRFAPESIDLLHIDGHHTEVAVRHDLDSWLPKLCPGGILLMHDVAVRERGFGVWKVWAELSPRGRAFAFSTPPGLAVWQKPATPLCESIPNLLKILFDGPNENRSALLQFYRERNQALQEMIARQWREGSIRQAPMASETVIQIFWTSDGGYSEEQSVDVRIGHESWKEVVVPLPASGLIRGLRIDFFSALTKIEITEIVVETAAAEVCYRASRPEEFAAISLGGDCVRVSLMPFLVQITGIDPQLYLPAFSPPVSDLTLKMRLRVLSKL
ncbi:MAG TPA: class I SAM-dependent methyltransferase [Chthoniobacterales bacterium]